MTSVPYDPDEAAPRAVTWCCDACATFRTSDPERAADHEADHPAHRLFVEVRDE